MSDIKLIDDKVNSGFFNKQYHPDRLIQVSLGSVLSKDEYANMKGIYCRWITDAYGRVHTQCHHLTEQDTEAKYCKYCGKEIRKERI